MAHEAHEEVEHATHASHDPFNRRVAMTMMVVAALLAGVKVLAHRSHNATLSYQIEAGAVHTQASNQWNFFQSKKMREVLARSEAKQLTPAHQSAPASEARPPLSGRDNRRAEIRKELEAEKVESSEEQAEKIVAAGEKRFQELVARGVPAERAEQVADSEMTALRYRTESRAIMERADHKEKEAREILEKSEHQHHRADYFDLGELFVELALVLCSVAILTKQTGFWYGGMAVCGLGVVIVVLGLFAH